MQRLWAIWGARALIPTYSAVCGSGGQPMQITSIKGGIGLWEAMTPIMTPKP